MRKIFPLFVFSCSCFSAWAQLDNTVEVTNEVKPVAADVKKVDVKAQAAETKVKHYTMQYAVQGQPLSHYAEEPLADYRSEAVWKGNRKGYLHLGGGSHGRVDGQACYQFDLSEADALSVDLSLQGFNGRTKDNFHNGVEDWKSRDYRNRMAAKFDHQLGQGVGLYVKGALENRMFNYMGKGSVTDKQHDVLGNLDLWLTSWRMEAFTMDATAGVDFARQDYRTSLAEKLSETNFHAQADAAYQLGQGHSVGLRLGFVGTSYANDELKGFARFRLTPHYVYGNEQMALRMGLFVSTKGHVAPDVSLTYHLNPASDVYVAASGSEEDNLFRRLTSIHPYFSLNPGEAERLEPEFHQIDARVGYRFRTGGGLSGHVNAGVDLSKNAPNIDWMTNAENGLLYPWMELSKSRRFYVNADLVYAYKDVLKVDGRHTLNIEDSKGEDDWLRGSYVTPAFQMLWQVDVKVLRGLYLGLDWDYAWYDSPNLSVVPGPAYERPATVNLGASLRYTLPTEYPLTLFAKGDNLLNRKFDRYFGYRHLGTNFLAGFALSF